MIRIGQKILLGFGLGLAILTTLIRLAGAQEPTPSVTQSGSGLTVTPNASQVGVWELFELTISHDDAPYGNPWQDVQVTCRFSGPQGQAIDIKGFYYDQDEWKVRFAPPTEGTWNWHLTLEAAEQSGAFEAVPSHNTGFLTFHSTNPYRFVDQHGNLFIRHGWNLIGPDPTCFPGQGCNGGRGGGRSTESLPPPYPDPDCDVVSPSTYASCHRWGGDEEWVTLDTYLTIFANGRFVLGRTFGSPLYWDKIDPAGNNTYSILRGKYLDTLLSKARQHGARIMFVLMPSPNLKVAYQLPAWPPAGLTPPSRPRALTANEKAILRDIIDYAMARYGAWVDIWELGNELLEWPDPYTVLLKCHHQYWTDWTSFVLAYVQANDPFHRPIATNFMPKADCGAPNSPVNVQDAHLYWYYGGPEQEAPGVAGYLDYRKLLEPDKPIVIGETGNKVCFWFDPNCCDGSPCYNYEGPAGPTKIRIRHWVATFAEATLIPWISNLYKQDKVSWYIDATARGYIDQLNTFTATFDADVLPVVESVGVSQRPDAQAQHLRSNKLYAAYIVNMLDHQVPITDLQLTIDNPVDCGNAIWVNPATGTVVGEQSCVPVGLITLSAPAFYEDIALKIHSIK